MFIIIILYNKAHKTFINTNHRLTIYFFSFENMLSETFSIEVPSICFL
jgi:hypothetical protein